MNVKRIGIFGALVLVLGGLLIFATGFRTLSLYNSAVDIRDSVKYLIETGGTVGQAAADSTLSSTYLEILFGDNPELLEQLKRAVNRGTADMPEVREGEISAIIVTYRKNGEDQIEDVVAHLMGGFPLGQRKISMHRDGFFASQVNKHLWATGDSALKFLGRDMIVWANSEEDEEEQRKLLNALFTGEIIELAEAISQKPVHYTAVFPSPWQIVPDKMRQHVKAILINGHFAPGDGSIEIVFLTSGNRSTAMVGSMAEDLKLSLKIALRTRFKGVVLDTAWGPNVPVWWAYEMANTLDQVEVTRQDLTVSMAANFDRRMVNAALKTMERFGRDYSHIQAVQEAKLDPRQVDAALRTPKPLHYWSKDHRWGPDWPFASGTNIFLRQSDEATEPLDTAPPVTETL